MQPDEPTTVAQVLDALDRRGFTEHFTPCGGRLCAVLRHRRFGADEVVVSESYRFEGVSVETHDGMRGTLTDAFGVYSDPDVGAFIAGVAVVPAGVEDPA